MENVTPKHLLCSIGACPAVFKAEDGTIVIVGKRDPTRAALLTKEGKVAPDEEVVFVDPALLENVSQ